MFKITAFPRLHVTLVAMGQTAYRINGGLGFSISDPKIEVKVSRTNKFSLIDLRKIKLVNTDVSKIEHSVNKAIEAYSFKHNVSITIKEGNLLSHIGLGAGTIIRLACIEGLFLVNGIKDYTHSEIVDYSGRGGTSGIGVRTYFSGGYVFDFGRKNNGEILSPSSLLEYRTNQSLLVNHGNMPNWKIGLCIPKGVNGHSNTAEKYFFSEAANLSKTAIKETLYECSFGALASIMENDFEVFSESIRNIQKMKWKAAERKIHGSAIEEAEQMLYDCGANAVGMSSMGPTLYFVGNDIKKTVNQSQRHLHEKYQIFETSMNNSGRLVHPQ